MILLLDGILAGASHVVSGPDHLAGVAPLAVDSPGATRRSGRVGWAWGLGHGLGVACLATLGQLFFNWGELEQASVWAERLVGFVLIVLGYTAWRRARHIVLHTHVHRHDGELHAHVHLHDARAEHQASHDHAAPAHRHRHNETAFGVGLLHGLAGAGHFLGVLPSLAMSTGQAAVYVGGYLLSTALVMALFGRALGRLASSAGVAWLPRIMQGVGAASVGVGVYWIASSWGAI